MNILIVEDDRTIASGLQYALEQEGYGVTVRGNVSGGLEAAAENDLALAIFDLSLPDGTGFDLLQKIREVKRFPIIFLTAADDEGNTVRALDMGADDYVTKPFRLRELIARIKNVLRRAGGEESSMIALPDGISISTLGAKVTRDGQEVILTALEYRLLLTLATNPGQILTREQLMEGIWDVAGNFVNDNTLSVYIRRLREKLEADPRDPKLIVTVRGLGYRLEMDVN